MMVAERVARGVAKMDQHYPGWWRKIDCGTLNIMSPCNCILGQVNPGVGVIGFLHGLNKLEIKPTPGIPFDYGFSGSTNTAAEWKRVIAHRLAEDAMAELNAVPEPVEVEAR
jgi:hypothetical protein